jgi:hypothetical protein
VFVRVASELQRSSIIQPSGWLGRKGPTLSKRTKSKFRFREAAKKELNQSRSPPKPTPANNAVVEEVIRHPATLGDDRRAVTNIVASATS